jgi:hypothetical protein
MMCFTSCTRIEVHVLTCTGPGAGRDFASAGPRTVVESAPARMATGTRKSPPALMPSAAIASSRGGYGIDGAWLPA